MILRYQEFNILELNYESINFMEYESAIDTTLQAEVFIDSEIELLKIKITSDLLCLNKKGEKQRQLELTVEYIFSIDYSDGEKEKLSNVEEHKEYYEKEIQENMKICTSLFIELIKTVTSIDMKPPVIVDMDHLILEQGTLE